MLAAKTLVNLPRSVRTLSLSPRREVVCAVMFPSLWWSRTPALPTRLLPSSIPGGKLNGKANSRVCVLTAAGDEMVVFTVVVENIIKRTTRPLNEGPLLCNGMRISCGVAISETNRRQQRTIQSERMKDICNPVQTALESVTYYSAWESLSPSLMSVTSKNIEKEMMRRSKDHIDLESWTYYPARNRK